MPRSEQYQAKAEPVLVPSIADTIEWFAPSPEVFRFSRHLPDWQSQDFSQSLVTLVCQGPYFTSSSWTNDATNSGTVTWTGFSTSLDADDAAYVQVALTPSDLSKYLLVTNFGFSIPASSTVQRITLKVERRADNSGVDDTEVLLWFGGAGSGNQTNLEGYSQWTTSATPEIATYRWASGLPTAAQVNDSGFGVAISINFAAGTGSTTAYVDYVTLEVCYSDGTDGTEIAAISSFSVPVPRPEPVPDWTTIAQFDDLFPVVPDFPWYAQLQTKNPEIRKLHPGYSFAFEKEPDPIPVPDISHRSIEDPISLFQTRDRYRNYWGELLRDEPLVVDPELAWVGQFDDPGELISYPPTIDTFGLLEFSAVLVLPDLVGYQHFGLPDLCRPDVALSSDVWRDGIIGQSASVPTYFVHQHWELSPRTVEQPEWNSLTLLDVFPGALPIDHPQWSIMPEPLRRIPDSQQDARTLTPDDPVGPVEAWLVDFGIPVMTSRVGDAWHYLTIEESQFEDPPAAPELSWFGEWDFPVALPRVHFTHGQDLIDESLFGTIDIHPGYWGRPLDVPLPSPRPTDPAIGSLQVYDDLFDPIPSATIDWLVETELPARTMQESTEIMHQNWFWPAGPASMMVYLTGASSYGGSQSDPDASLGDYRSSTYAQPLEGLILNLVDGITIEHFSGANRTGSAAIQVFNTTSGYRLHWQAPNGTLGPAIRIQQDQPQTLYDAADGSKYVRVTVDSETLSVGKSRIEMHDRWNNVFGMLDADESESSAGSDRYRTVMIECESLSSLHDLSIYVGSVAPSATAAGGLGISGASDLDCSEVDGFCYWPHEGWCHIVKADGSTREIVYYSSRDENQLNIPAFGRALLGTSSSAGVTGDTLYCVPPIRIATELASPAAEGNVQTLANETTAPTSVSWVTGIDALSGAYQSRLHSHENLAIHIHRELPAGVIASPLTRTAIKVQFTVDSVTYTEDLSGLFRIEDDDLERYELYIQSSSVLDISSGPTETFTAGDLPYTASMSLTDGTWYVWLGQRNKHNLLSLPPSPTEYVISGGARVIYPSSPVDSEIVIESGKFRIKSKYLYVDDMPNHADAWLIYLTTDGSDPDVATTAPIQVAGTLVGGDPLSLLSYLTGTYADSTVAKAIIRTYRTSDGVESQNTNIVTATMTSTGTGAPTGHAFLRGKGEV